MEIHDRTKPLVTRLSSVNSFAEEMRKLRHKKNKSLRF